MKKLSSTAAIGLSLLAAALAASPIAFAASKPAPGTGQALEIAPPILTLNANPGQTIHATIAIRDVAKTDLVVTNQINDFTAAGEDGTPKILTGDDSDNPYAMKTWIKALPSLTLSPQKIQKLDVTIAVPANASPGGHYGVIRFTGTPPNLEGQGVSLSASLGALVLLTVNGNLTHQLAIKEFATTKIPPEQNAASATQTATDMPPTKLFESTPINFLLKFQNKGNVQEEPVGHIVVTNMFGKAVAGINVNLDRRNVLPGTVRKFQAQLDKNVLGNKKLFGLFHAKLTVSYGKDNKQQLTDSVTFWVIPYKLIIGAVVLLVVGFFVLRTMIRRYNQSIISRAQGSSTKRSKPAPRKRKR